MTPPILESNQTAHRQEAGSAILLLNFRILKRGGLGVVCFACCISPDVQQRRPSSHGSLWRKSLGPMSEINGHLHHPQAPPLAESMGFDDHVSGWLSCELFTGGISC